jgi:hypothetical protein
MLKADDARHLMPKHNISMIISEIEKLIEISASDGLSRVNIHHLIPEWTAWAIGKRSKLHNELAQIFMSNGYELEMDSGGFAGTGYIRLVWNKE